MNTGIVAAVLVALTVGRGVYSSCTRHVGILRAALFIDAVGAVVLIIFLWAIGVFQT